MNECQMKLMEFIKVHSSENR